MKRMALSLAALFVLASALLYLFGLKAVFILGTCLCFATVCAVFYNRKWHIGLKPAAVLLVGAAFCLYLNIYTIIKVERIEALADSTHTVVCRVVEEPEYYETYTRFEVETDGSNGFDGGAVGKVKLFVNIRSYMDASKAEDGDILRLNLDFAATDGIYNKYYKSENIFISTQCNSAEVIGHKESLYTKCIELRRSVRQAIDSHTEGDIAAILQGLLLGGTDKMSNELYSQFKSCGVTHITAVSGMHISAFCTMILTLLNLKLKRRKAAAITLFPLVTAVMLAGFTPSAVRSGIMCGTMLLSQVLLKKGDSLNSLGVSIALMVIYNPYNVCSLGFQLSCSAAAGVILVTPYALSVAERITAKIKWEKTSSVIEGIVVTFFQSVGAVVCTLPFQIVELGYISLIAPIASLFICGASVYAMAVCVVGIITHYLPFFDYISMAVFTVARFLAEYIRAVVKILSEIPFSYVAFGDNYAILWLGISLAVVAIWMIFGRQFKVRIVAFIIALMLVVTLWAEQIHTYNVGTVAALDVGNGLCVVVTLREECVIIGCGDGYSDILAVEDYLKTVGYSEVDLLLIPSDSDTCYGGFQRFVERFEPMRVVAPENLDGRVGYSGDIEWIGDNTEIISGSRNLKIKPHFIETGCIYELTLCDRQVVISHTKFDGKDTGVKNTDILIAGRVAPVDVSAEITVVSAENDEYLKIYPADGRKIATAGRSIAVKIKEGKVKGIYAR